MASPSPAQLWEPVWQAVQPYVRFLRQVAGRYQWASAKLGSEDADDLLQEFCLEHLPRVLDHLERVPDDDREAYLRVVFRNFVSSHVRRAARYRAALQSFAELDAGGQLAPRVPPIAAHVRPELPPMVEEFFVQGTSIRDLARNFGISRYAVRKAVVDGGLLLALSSSGQADLSRTEIAVCRLILLDHLSVAAAAETLGITETDAKRALSSARGWINQQLRK
jgi:DNA-directed RNA polymerase specialized sigma24 family protein